MVTNRSEILNTQVFSQDLKQMVIQMLAQENGTEADASELENYIWSLVEKCNKTSQFQMIIQKNDLKKLIDFVEMLLFEVYENYLYLSHQEKAIQYFVEIVRRQQDKLIAQGVKESEGEIEVKEATSDSGDQFITKEGPFKKPEEEKEAKTKEKENLKKSNRHDFFEEIKKIVKQAIKKEKELAVDDSWKKYFMRQVNDLSNLEKYVSRLAERIFEKPQLERLIQKRDFKEFADFVEMLLKKVIERDLLLNLDQKTVRDLIGILRRHLLTVEQQKLNRKSVLTFIQGNLPGKFVPVIHFSKKVQDELNALLVSSSIKVDDIQEALAKEDPNSILDLLEVIEEKGVLPFLKGLIEMNSSASFREKLEAIILEQEKGFAKIASEAEGRERGEIKEGFLESYFTPHSPSIAFADSGPQKSNEDAKEEKSELIEKDAKQELGSDDTPAYKKIFASLHETLEILILPGSTLIEDLQKELKVLESKDPKFVLNLLDMAEKNEVLNFLKALKQHKDISNTSLLKQLDNIIRSQESVFTRKEHDEKKSEVSKHLSSPPLSVSSSQDDIQFLSKELRLFLVKDLALNKDNPATSDAEIKKLVIIGMTRVDAVEMLLGDSISKKVNSVLAALKRRNQSLESKLALLLRKNELDEAVRLLERIHDEELGQARLALNNLIEAIFFASTFIDSELEVKKDQGKALQQLLAESGTGPLVKEKDQKTSGINRDLVENAILFKKLKQFLVEKLVFDTGHLSPFNKMEKEQYAEMLTIMSPTAAMELTLERYISETIHSVVEIIQERDLEVKVSSLIQNRELNRVADLLGQFPTSKALKNMIAAIRHQPVERAAQVIVEDLTWQSGDSKHDSVEETKFTFSPKFLGSLKAEIHILLKTRALFTAEALIPPNLLLAISLKLKDSNLSKMRKELLATPNNLILLRILKNHIEFGINNTIEDDVLIPQLKQLMNESRTVEFFKCLNKTKGGYVKELGDIVGVDVSLFLEGAPIKEILPNFDSFDTILVLALQNINSPHLFIRLNESLTAALTASLASLSKEIKISGDKEKLELLAGALGLGGLESSKEQVLLALQKLMAKILLYRAQQVFGSPSQIEVAMKNPLTFLESLRKESSDQYVSWLAQQLITQITMKPVVVPQQQPSSVLGIPRVSSRSNLFPSVPAAGVKSNDSDNDSDNDEEEAVQLSLKLSGVQKKW